MFKNDPNLEQGKQFLMFEQNTKDTLLPSLNLIEKTTSSQLTSIIEAMSGANSTKSKSSINSKLSDKKTNINNLEQEFNSTLVEYTTLYKTLSTELLVNNDLNKSIDKVNSIKPNPIKPVCKAHDNTSIGMFCSDDLINEFPIKGKLPKDIINAMTDCEKAMATDGKCPDKELTKKPPIQFKIQESDIKKLNLLDDKLLNLIEQMMVEIDGIENKDVAINNEIEQQKIILQKYKDNLNKTRQEINGNSRHNINI